MPEGHSVHRIARQFRHNFRGKTVRASSPQGRFAEGASVLDGRTITDVDAVGKQMFMHFGDDVWLRVHLGMYGAWDFAGQITTDPTIESAAGRMGQTNQRGTVLAEDAADADAERDADAESDGEAHAAAPASDAPRTGKRRVAAAGNKRDDVLLAELRDADGEDSVSSIGAPRRARVRMSEQTKGLPENDETFPPEPVGAVRVRLLTDTTVADLRGPTACEVVTGADVQRVIDSLGPDPQHDDTQAAEDRFTATVRKKPTPIGLLLMDQKVVSGIGNVYRAELLFRAKVNPHTPGKLVPEETVRGIWRDWVRLLAIGIETGQMMTMDDLDDEAYRLAMASRADRHWVYKREGLPCRVCGTHISLEEMGARKLYWCPVCQA